MKHLLMLLALNVGVLALQINGFSQAAPRKATANAKSLPRTPDGKPDFSGAWKTISSKVDPIQPTAWGTKRLNYNKLPEGSGGRPELDPILNCYRPGLARIGPPLLVPADSIQIRKEGETIPAPGGPSAFDAVTIAYAPGRIWLVYEYLQESRQIFLDGRKPPEIDPDDVTTKFWNGFSTGKWDGDTLVVDTTNLRDEIWLDNLGHEAREMHVVERFRRVDADTLEVERTITDPVALAKPYISTAILKLSSNLTLQENMLCGQYYKKRIAFGYEGILGISNHPWQGPDRTD